MFVRNLFSTFGYMNLLNTSHEEQIQPWHITLQKRRTTFFNNWFCYRDAPESRRVKAFRVSRLSPPDTVQQRCPLH
jgi:hypothetical protein